MCRVKSKWEVVHALAAEARRRDCETVRRELAEAYQIRDAYVDPELLRQARIHDWSRDQWEEKVREKVFGKSKPGQGPAYVSPMGTDPMTCRIKRKLESRAVPQGEASRHRL